ncbi:hypothetical protein ACLOJK_025944 [Asimina triloba]
MNPSTSPSLSSSSSSSTSWFSGIVRGRSASQKIGNHANMNSSADRSAHGSAHGQFVGQLFKYGPKSVQHLVLGEHCIAGVTTCSALLLLRVIVTSSDTIDTTLGELISKRSLE